MQCEHGLASIMRIPVGRNLALRFGLTWVNFRVNCSPVLIHFSPLPCNIIAIISSVPIIKLFQNLNKCILAQPGHTRRQGCHYGSIQRRYGGQQQHWMVSIKILSSQQQHYISPQHWILNFVIAFSVVIKSKVQCHMALTVTLITCKYMPITMSESKCKMKRTEWSVSQHLATSNTKAGWGPRSQGSAVQTSRTLSRPAMQMPLLIPCQLKILPLFTRQLPFDITSWSCLILSVQSFSLVFLFCLKIKY